MRPRRRVPRSSGRSGAAAVELALILPLLCYVCVVTIDFARLFFAWTTLATCAFNGAYYLSDSNVAAATGYSSVQEAAQDDADNISPTPTVGSTTGTDGSGTAYVEVTVTYTFTTLFNYPGIATSTTISRKLRMAKTPP